MVRSMIAARAAGVIVLLEGAGIGALAVWEIVAVITGDTAALDSAIALIVLTLAGAA
ncbi:MAG TPA: histidine kinase, partial [Microbacterium sp.]|nr:histidine kinase [Microbacterium sp.]